MRGSNNENIIFLHASEQHDPCTGVYGTHDLSAWCKSDNTVYMEERRRGMRGICLRDCVPSDGERVEIRAHGYMESWVQPPMVCGSELTSLHRGRKSPRLLRPM
jgi:hypothetical protein